MTDTKKPDSEETPEEQVEEPTQAQAETWSEAAPDDESPGAAPVPAAPASDQSASEQIPKKPFLNTTNACLLALLIFAISCCCGMFFATGATALIYEAIEGPYTQVVTEFAVTQVLTTQVVCTPAPTFTPFPTITPIPTQAPPPTPELPSPTIPPAPTAEPTSPPDFSEIYRFQGVGTETTDLFSLQGGITRIKWTYTGTGNFVLNLKRLDIDYEELIDNATGPTDGQVILNLEASDQYLFDITAGDGDWEIIVEYRP